MGDRRGAMGDRRDGSWEMGDERCERKRSDLNEREEIIN
jgi:hypothetical protein